MRTCQICGTEITNRTTINGKVVNTQRRKMCFACSPFGSGNNKLLKGNLSEADKMAVLARREKTKWERTRSPEARSLTVRNQKIFRKERKKKLLSMFGGACRKCGYSRCVRALEFHHKDREAKAFNLSMLGYTCSWKRLVEEASKCEILCSNCHREIEDEFDTE
jgi:hypothetical protein